MRNIVITALVMLTACGERDEALPNGYRFVEVSRGNGLITKDSEIAVYPNVVEHEVRGNLLTGKRVLAQDNTDGSRPFTSGLGFFVFDTSTGRLQQGLSKPPGTNGK